MTYLLKGGYVVVPHKARIKVEKRDLYVINGKIVNQPEKPASDQVIDCTDKIIMPGMVNAHHHIYSTLSKGIPCQVPFGNFMGNLENLWWTLDRALDEESVALSTVLTMEDCLKNGVTTVFDHHISASYIKGSLSRMAEIFDAYDVQGTLAFEISDRNGEKIMQGSLAENLEFAEKQKGKSVQGILGMHASFTLSDKSLEMIAKESGNLPIHIHVSEDVVDRDVTLRDYNSFIIERLISFGLMRKNSLLVHCSNLIRQELELMGEHDIFAVQAVDSNMNNGLNVANIRTLTDLRIKTALGTDGMSSNILKSFKNSFIFCKYLNRDADIGFPEMKWLLSNSFELKKAYGYDLGIKQGDKADLVVIDYQPATEFDEDSFLSHWIFGITEARIQHVLKGEKLLLDNYELTFDPYKEFKKKSQRIASDLFKRFEEIGG